ncbi:MULTISPECIES: response regulator transcription factor [Jeotgalicoccus]|uniref:response regulator n=1 Tax=Jeotgalicoccus TaxID=227979 RepID=UPI000429D9E5|nr:MULTISPECIES: response regulator transcription factor [Jeotgalicoccus]QQD85119.1 response regulator transcription factor [Jeotgalicoccus sp. ATCC 8456]
MYNIILTDDHQVVREGMKFLLSTTEDLKVINDFDSGEDTLNFLSTTEEKIDLALIDLVMPEMDGIELTTQLKEKYKNIKVLVLSSYTSEEYIRPVFRAGADGYIIKEMDIDELTNSIRDVIEGKRVVHPDILKIIDEGGVLPHEKNVLSRREMEVLKEIVNGLSNKEISETLFVSEKTVKTHVSHILNKLEVSDRTQAAIYAIKFNIIEF